MLICGLDFQVTLYDDHAEAGSIMQAPEPNYLSLNLRFCIFHLFHRGQII